MPYGFEFTMMPFKHENLWNVTFTVDGTIYMSEDNERWPNETEKNCANFWEIYDSEYIYIRGNGTIDG